MESCFVCLFTVWLSALRVHALQHHAEYLGIHLLVIDFKGLGLALAEIVVEKEGPEIGRMSSQKLNR